MQGEVLRLVRVGRCGRREYRSMGSAWQPHGNSGSSKLLLERSGAGDTEMKDTGGQCGIGLAACKNVDEVCYRSSATGGDDRDAHRFADCGSEFAVEPGTRTVGVHRREQDFAGSARFRFPCPLNNGAASGLAASVDEYLRSAARILSLRIAAGIDSDDYGLRAKRAADGFDQRGMGERGG